MAPLVTLRPRPLEKPRPPEVQNLQNPIPKHQNPNFWLGFWLLQFSINFMWGFCGEGLGFWISHLVSSISLCGDFGSLDFGIPCNFWEWLSLQDLGPHSFAVSLSNSPKGEKESQARNASHHSRVIDELRKKVSRFWILTAQSQWAGLKKLPRAVAGCAAAYCLNSFFAWPYIAFTFWHGPNQLPLVYLNGLHIADYVVTFFGKISPGLIVHDMNETLRLCTQ